MWVVLAVSVFLTLIGIGFGITEYITRHMESQNLAQEVNDAVSGASTGLILAKESLKSDAVWGDCTGADRYCSEKDSQGAFPLYSPSLDTKLENYEINGIKITVKVKFPDSKTALVYVKAKSTKAEYSVGAKFTKSGGKAELPLVYAPNSVVEGGRACSYFWDETKITGITEPNFTIYLGDYFNWSPEIVVPTDPAGDNPKEVIFATDFSTEVHGYDEIDKIYTTGDLYLLDEAHIGLAYANGKVYIEEGSSADQVVENGEFQYPDFAKDFPENDLDYWGDIIYCYGTLTLPPGEYGRLYVFAPCDLYLTEGEYKFEDIFVENWGWLPRGNSSTKAFLSPFFFLRVHYKGKVKILSTYSYIYSSVLFTKETPDSSILLIGNIVSISDTVFCEDPTSCMIDTNYLYNYSELIGFTNLARRGAFFYYSETVGNTYSAFIYSKYSTFCNIVDSEGNQLYSNQENFYSIVAPNGISLPGEFAERLRVICANEEDCFSQLE